MGAIVNKIGVRNVQSLVITLILEYLQVVKRLSFGKIKVIESIIAKKKINKTK